MNVLAAMMCLGAFTLLAQMAVMRELTVLCLGNELTVGVAFTVWLLAIGAGMWAGRIVDRVRTKPDARRQVVVLLMLLAPLLPAVMVLLRWFGGIGRGGSGEYVPLPLVFAIAALVLVPVALPAGMIFPAACQVVTRAGRRSVSALYAAEAAGSFLGGAGYSFLLVGRLGGVHVAVLGAGLALLGAALVLDAPWRRRLLPVAIGLAAIPVLLPACLNGLEWRSVEARWRTFGILSPAAGEIGGARLAASFDTRYQSLALVDSEGQFTLYGDGQVMFSFPDETGSELAVAFVMAQKPRARRVLLLGGNPLGDVAHLLKYPVETVVHVELDPGVEAMVSRALPEAAAVLSRDPRLHRVVQDGPLFVSTCRERFEVILVHPPEPLTGSLNRFYTREFYGNVRRLLAPGGFMHTSVEGSEQLEDEASRMASSIYRALNAVFPEVRVTSGSPLHFFAAGEKGTLTFDRDALAGRWKSAAVSTLHFRPEYFLGADEIDPDKMDRTERRLLSAPAEMNTLLRPVSHYYALALWGRYSGSPLSPLLHRIERIPAGGVGTAVLLAGAGCWAAGLARRRRALADTAWDRPGGRAVVFLVLAGVGFCGVALELILVYIFQGLYGYVYNRIGLMVGLFMLGSIAGARVARQWEKAAPEIVRRRMMLANGVLLAVALAVPLLMPVLAVGGWPGENAVYLMMTVIGAGVGAQFVGAFSLLQAMGFSRVSAAAATGAADYGGAALGGILVGVLFVPIWGLAAACAIVASVLGAGLLCLASFPRRLS